MNNRSLSLTLDNRLNDRYHEEYMKNFYNENESESLNKSTYFVPRKPMNQVQFDEQFNYSKPQHENEMKKRSMKLLKKYYTPFTTCNNFKTFLFSLIPIIDWLPKYQIKTNLTSDILGGITVGVMHVPQGIAYAMLAKQPPINGIYTSLFAPLIYMIFGTSKHCSLGSFAVVALMTGLTVDRVAMDNTVAGNSSLIDAVDGITPVEVSTALTATIGLILLVMGLLRLQFLTTYMSDQVIAGFTTGSSIHVLVSQLKTLVGVRGLPRRSGPGYIFFHLFDLICNIYRANLVCCGISLVAVIILHFGKEYLTPFVKKKTKSSIPIPFELIVVVLSTIFVALTGVHETQSVQVVSYIPTGLPDVKVPRADLFPRVLPDAVSMTVVSVAVHLSIGKMLAKKMQYDFDAGQELFAMSFASLGSSFFPVFPFSCSLSRTLVALSAGVATQFSILFASILVLLVMLFFGQFLETLPMCVLASIIIVALQGMLRKIGDLKGLWKVSKIDCCIWIVSFGSTVLIDVSEGLIISVGFALFTTILREQYPKWHILASVKGTTDFRDTARYGSTVYYKGICIFRFDAPLLFHNVECFKKSAEKAYCEWQKSHEFHVLREERDVILKPMMEEVSTDTEKHQNTLKSIDGANILSRHFIIDCSGFTFIDLMGVNVLKEVFSDMRKRGVLVYFAQAKAPVRELFEKCDFYQTVPKENFYPTMKDATAIARQRQLELGFKDTDYVPEHDGLSEILSVHPHN